MERKIELLDWIRIRANINVLYWQIKTTLDEIKEKRPERTDYITSMELSLIWLVEASAFLVTIERGQIMMSKEIYRLELENMQLKYRLSVLEKINTKLLDDATL